MYVQFTLLAYLEIVSQPNTWFVQYICLIIKQILYSLLSTFISMQNTNVSPERMHYINRMLVIICTIKIKMIVEIIIKTFNQ